MLEVNQPGSRIEQVMAKMVPGLFTLQINIDPARLNGLEDEFPLKMGDFQGLC
jgi:hypothetical protein